MEFLVEFELEVPAGTPDEEVDRRQRAESDAAAKLAEDGHLVRLWRRPLVGDGINGGRLVPRRTARQSLTVCSTPCPSRTGCGSRSRPLEAHQNDPTEASR